MKNELGKWVQSAIVCQSIGNCSEMMAQGDQSWRQPHVNLSLLQTRFHLHVKHQVGTRPVDITLSDVPWTSGIYREILPSSPNIPEPLQPATYDQNNADEEYTPEEIDVAQQPSMTEPEAGPSQPSTFAEPGLDPPPPYNPLE